MLQFVSGAGGFLAIAFGAFGAHALKNLERYQGTLPANVDSWWQTATMYLLVHSALGFALSLSAADNTVRLAALIMVGGAMLFAATLYAMGLGAPSWFGAITPIGGLAMLVGWGLLIWTGFKS